MAVVTLCNTLATYDRDPERMENEIAATVAAIMEYVGMKTRTIENILSLLTRPQKIRDAVKTGAIPVSQGYILAANLGNPGLTTVFVGIDDPAKRMPDDLEHFTAGRYLPTDARLAKSD
jgi:hypothetical protein